MAISLNHTIVHARDKEAAARFLTEMLGLPPHRVIGHFAIVQLGETSLDFIDTNQPVSPRHFAFLMTEDEFDASFARIRAHGLPYWADPAHTQPGEINHWDDGRGVYFDSPDGHRLEIMTRPYGSGGLGAKHVNPLLL